MEKAKQPYSSHRRVRANRHIRELTADVVLSHRDFVQPLFLDQSVGSRTPLTNLNEINADSIDSLVDQIRKDLAHGPFRDACKSSPGSNPALKDRKSYQASAFSSVDGFVSAMRDSESKAHVEVWTSIKRAGGSIIISYASRHARKWIDEIEY